MQLSIPITKIDLVKREVWGVAAVEQPDRAREILDYETSKPLFQGWSDEVAKDSGGKSLGNLRAMHTKTVAGKLIAFATNDVAKQFEIGTKVVDDNEWKKVEEGCYTGFSIGGDYERRWDDPVLKGVVRYTARPQEISLVDRPCIPGATFEAIKADGTKELRKFVEATPATPGSPRLSDDDVDRLAKAVAALSKAKKTKSVDGEELSAKDFAFVGDSDDPETWKLPVHDEGHAKDALSRFNQTEGIPADKKEKVARKIIAAAKKHGIDASSFAEEYAKAAYGRALAKRAQLRKNMWDVGTLAQIMCSLSCMEDSLAWEADVENDDSKIPARLRGALIELKQIFLDLAAEEVSELVGEKAAKAAQSQIQKEVGSMLTQLNKAIQMAGASSDPEMKKMETHLKEIGKHVDKIAKCHSDMGDSIKALQGEGDEEETPEKKAEREKKEKEDAEKAARGTLNKAQDDRMAKMEETLAKQSEVLGLLANHLVPTPVATTAVAKSADTGNQPSAEVKDPNEAIKAAHANGPTRRIT